MTNSRPAPRHQPIDTAAYAELRAIAARALAGERRVHTLAPTDLVHEAWVRIARAGDPGAEAELPLRLRAARTMREVLVDHARRRRAIKRDAGRTSSLDEHADGLAQSESDARDDDLIELDLALVELADLAPDLAAVVELRFFGGCSVEEAALELDLSPRTVKRRWQLAKGWLAREIAGGDGA